MTGEGAATPGLVRAAVPVPLSGREREIAMLAAVGTASKDIAERLFLLVRTVNNRLQHVYTKGSATAPPGTRPGNDLMTPEQISLVQSSFERLGPQLPAMATRFYQELFRRDPALRPLFTPGLAEQEVKFAGKLAEIVHAIPRLDDFLTRPASSSGSATAAGRSPDCRRPTALPLPLRPAHR
jgi:DNA-binding CsgD family transcriptional regulator